MLWDMHLCVFDVRLSFENRVLQLLEHFAHQLTLIVHNYSNDTVYVYANIYIKSLKKLQSNNNKFNFDC